VVVKMKEAEPISELLSELKNFPRPAGIFIDGPNTFGALRELNWHINWRNFAGLMKNLFGQDVSLYFCTANDSKNEGQQNFLSILEEVGFKIFLQEVVKKTSNPNLNFLNWLYNPYAKKFPNKNGKDHRADFCINKGDIDAFLGFLIGKFMPQFKTLVLFSGDYNFFPVVKSCINEGKEVVIMSFKCSLSLKLANLASKVVFLEEPNIKPYLVLQNQFRN